MAKGEIIVEGAKCFCSNSVANNSKATAVPLVVKSQSKKLKENKYFAQEKPIATNLDNTAESFNNGEGFGDCYLPDKKKKPCKGQCSIKYKDFYKNVDFDKSTKVLLDISTGICPGYGVPGTITFTTTGQKKAVNTIDVKEADSFTVENTSAQWETSDPTKENSVSEITIVAPLAEKPTGKYYFIEKAKNTNIWPSSMPVSEAKLQLKAIYKGDPTKITWAIFKGDEVKDKVKTFVGIGANIVFTLGTLFKDLEEGLYRIEAYVNRPGYKDCAILIEYIKDHVEGITAPGKTLLKHTPIPLTLKFKATSLVEKQKILNPASLNPVYETSPIASWRVTCKNTVIFNSQISSESNLIKVETKTGALGIFTFKNPDEYQVEAYTSPNDSSPIKITLKVLESLGVNTVKGTCNQLLRYNESLKVEVSKFNVEFLPTNTTKMQWYLQKDGIRLTAFENAAISKEKSINKPINQILYNDAQGGNNYFGKYAIEGYGKPTNRPLFNASDSFFFEVIRNSIDKVTLPKSIPKGAKVKLETAARIMPLIGDEKINLELPNDVVDNHDGTITFNSEGEFDIAAYLTGEETLDTKVNTKIKVATPELKRALWAYSTGYKRTETGYKEETHAFVEIAGLENQTITIKVWVRGISESFYLEPATYMLEEKKISLNDKGIGSFKITTDDKYKDKIKKALPATTEVPNPIISLIFTVEMPTGSQGTITLPNDMDIKNGKLVVGTKFIEVLDSNEELAVTNEQKIKSIFFAKEDGKGLQQTLTHQAKTHKIWVHTVNMQEEELRVDVMSLVHSDCMDEKNGIITVLQSIQEYKEKVGSDGLLELPFTAEEKYLTDAEANPVRFSIQVSRKVKDPNDDKKEVYVFEDDQLAEMPYPNASLVRSPDMKTVGIKAIKQDETPFSKEEKLALRKQLICFKNTALIVAKGILTEEAIENCTVPVVVDLEMAELVKADSKKLCPNCDNDITLTEIKAICVGKKDNNGAEKCLIDNDTIISAALPFLNQYRKKVGINTCVRKAHFLAQICQETKFYDLQEKFTYRYSERMRKIFDSYFSTFGVLENQQAEARRLSSLSLNESNAQEVASAIYGPTHPLGKEHTNPNDGWRYSGKGFKQITWKENYRNIQKYFNKSMKIDNEPDVLWLDDDNPYKLKNNAKDAITSALAFWGWKNINAVTNGSTDDNVELVTKIINSKKEGLEERQRFFKKAVEVLKVKECKPGLNLAIDVNQTYDKKYQADSKTAYINVILPKDRKYQGLLVFFDNSGTLFSSYVLGNGTGSDKFKAEGKGATPNGLWSTWHTQTHVGDVSYGNHGLIHMTGLEGDALTATKNGRSGIAIHAGHTVGYDKLINDRGELMITYGCLRIYNADIGNLVKKYLSVKDVKEIKVYVEEVDNINEVYEYYDIERDPIERKEKSKIKQKTQ
ncbi:PAAR-like protein [Flavobacterium geliluteum]|uniref:DUF4280 domain-containing protein n=1 Tax=Flavobacterium geliluteum TaxID=2816120 RepID=A0A941AWK0_9FLAO|nr:PAAR-like protein [Flavobacterium geliluteum]MBP4136751.1 DUF4280 domain-containing protein [Flavobacterium geliluteum]